MCTYICIYAAAGRCLQVLGQPLDPRALGLRGRRHEAELGVGVGSLCVAPMHCYYYYYYYFHY